MALQTISELLWIHGAPLKVFSQNLSHSAQDAQLITSALWNGTVNPAVQPN